MQPHKGLTSSNRTLGDVAFGLNNKAQYGSQRPGKLTARKGNRCVWAAQGKPGAPEIPRQLVKPGWSKDQLEIMQRADQIPRIGRVTLKSKIRVVPGEISVHIRAISQV